MPESVNYRLKNLYSVNYQSACFKALTIARTMNADSKSKVSFYFGTATSLVLNNGMSLSSAFGYGNEDWAMICFG